MFRRNRTEGTVLFVWRMQRGTGERASRDICVERLQPNNPSRARELTYNSRGQSLCVMMLPT